MEKKVELSTSEAVEATVEAMQREIALGAAAIRSGLAIWEAVEESMKFIPEYPALIRNQSTQISVSVEGVLKETEDVARKMSREPQEAITEFVDEARVAMLRKVRAV